jgi:hypothetical protein
VAAALIGAIVVLTVSRAGSGGDPTGGGVRVADRLPGGIASPAPAQPRRNRDRGRHRDADGRRPPATRARPWSRSCRRTSGVRREDTAALGALLAPDVVAPQRRSVPARRRWKRSRSTSGSSTRW